MSTHLTAVLAGCGGISGSWLKPIKEIPGLKIVGLVDLIEDNARRRTVEFDLPQAVVGVDLDRILDATHPDIVFDCTIPEAHLPTTLAALRHGCHVLGEKPLADSMVHAREMVAAAQSVDKLYAVMQNRRYLEQTRRLQQFIASGAIGPLTTVNCDFFLGPHFGGFREQMEHVLLMDMAIHTFDQARYMTGADPSSVYCKEWNPPGSWYSHGASAVAIFEMCDPRSSNEMVYTYRGSWCAEGLRTSWEAEWRFIGLYGSLKWDGHQGFTAESVSQTNGFWSDAHPLEIPDYTNTKKTEGHASCIREFVEAVRTGTTPDTICTDNIKSLDMVFGAIKSAGTGKHIKLNKKNPKI
jgi:predicted dehydrogenase